MAAAAQNAKPQDKPEMLKLVLLGYAGSGKTSLLLRFTDDTFAEKFAFPVGIDFKIRAIELDGVKLKLQVWDLPRKLAVDTQLASPHKGGVAGYIITYDSTTSTVDSSFCVSKWVAAIKDLNVPYIVASTKTDLGEQTPEVTAAARKHGLKLADEARALAFFETSAKYSRGVDEMFVEFARLIKHPPPPKSACCSLM